MLMDRWDDVFDFYHNNFGVLAIDKKLRKTLKNLSFGDMKPDLVFYLRIDPIVAIQRCSKQRRFFESNRLNNLFQKKLHIFYEKRAKSNNWLVINGDDKKNNISQKIIDFLIKKVR